MTREQALKAKGALNNYWRQLGIRSVGLSADGDFYALGIGFRNEPTEKQMTTIRGIICEITNKEQANVQIQDMPEPDISWKDNAPDILKFVEDVVYQTGVGPKTR